ncbi:sigma-70 family RNA polymerase sigma factor [Actinosynnema sp. CA-299493]
MDRRGFSPVVRERTVRWRRVAFLICGDWALAEDVVQTALLRLYKQWHRIDEDGLEAYARTVIARLAVSEAKRHRRRSEVLGGPPDRPMPGSVTEDVLDVRAALSRVPARQRAVLVLRFYCDMTVEQTAGSCASARAP